MALNLNHDLNLNMDLNVNLALFLFVAVNFLSPITNEKQFRATNLSNKSV